MKRYQTKSQFFIFISACMQKRQNKYLVFISIMERGQKTQIRKIHGYHALLWNAANMVYGAIPDKIISFSSLGTALM